MRRSHSGERPQVDPFESPFDHPPSSSRYTPSDTSTLAEEEWPKEDNMDEHMNDMDDIRTMDEYDCPDYGDLEYAQEILEEQIYCPTVKVGFRTLFKYATRKDLIIVFISIVCAIITGVAIPLTNVSSQFRPTLFPPFTVLTPTNYRLSTVTLLFNSKSSSRVI
jgi:hypothetical protein